MNAAEWVREASKENTNPCNTITVMYSNLVICEIRLIVGIQQILIMKRFHNPCLGRGTLYVLFHLTAWSVASQRLWDPARCCSKTPVLVRPFGETHARRFWVCLWLKCRLCSLKWNETILPHRMVEWEDISS